MKNTKRLGVIGALATAGVVIAGGPKAFPVSTNWHDDASYSPHCGASDNWSNGSNRDWGITCNLCHINDASQQGYLNAIVTGLPPGNQYTPGQTYALKLTMLWVPPDKERGLTKNNNRNGFTATIEDTSGKTAGSFLGDQQTSCPPVLTSIEFMLPGQTYAYGDCHAIASLEKSSPTPTSWNFQWVAPEAGAGPLTLYYGVVDGDGDQKSLGDDVKLGTISLTQGP